MAATVGADSSDRVYAGSIADELELSGRVVQQNSEFFAWTTFLV
jgi:hypothetical protein